MPLPPFPSLKERLIMQVELVGGPKDGGIIGVPEDDRQEIRFPFMRTPIYLSWTAAKEPTPQEVNLDAHVYRRIKGLSVNGYPRFAYVKGT